ncbi:MAG: hypothetical protein ACE5HE_09910 [Phycisphaerae bacterium]
MESVQLDTTRLNTVLTMFRITQGGLARAARVSPAMVSLTLAGKKHPSIRTAVALVQGLESLLTQARRLDTTYFLTIDEDDQAGRGDPDACSTACPRPNTDEGTTRRG